MALDLIDELEAIISALETARIEYALCGGLALGIHGLPRFTKDIDLLVAREDVDAAKQTAKGLGFDVPSRKMIFKQGTPAEQEFHRLSKLDPDDGSLMSVDFLVVTPVFAAVWAGRARIAYGAREITVVSREGLVTMKTIAGRPQDLVDIARLQDPDDEASE